MENKNPSTKKPATSYRISDVAKDQLAMLATHHGISRAGVLEMLIRAEARRIGVKKRANAKEE